MWIGVFAPGGTPARVVERLNRELNDIASSPELRALLEPDGMVPVPVSPESLAQRVRSELAQWKQLASESRIVVE